MSSGPKRQSNLFSYFKKVGDDSSVKRESIAKRQGEASINPPEEKKPRLDMKPSEEETKPIESALHRPMSETQPTSDSRRSSEPGPKAETSSRQATEKPQRRRLGGSDSESDFDLKKISRRRVRKVQDESDDDYCPEQKNASSSEEEMKDDLFSEPEEEPKRKSVTKKAAPARRRSLKGKEDFDREDLMQNAEEDESIASSGNTGVLSDKFFQFKGTGEEAGQGDGEEEREVMLSSKIQKRYSVSHSKISADNILQTEEKKKLFLATTAAKTSKVFRLYVEAIFNQSHHFSWPLWILPDNIRDANNYPALDERYDCSTLKIPSSLKECKQMRPDQSTHYTPAMAQYWNFKANHFDKIVLFKMGKFYELFYIDAVIAQRILDLKWMYNSEKPHVGFPEVSLHWQSKKLLEHNLQVVVIEQTETPLELAERNANQNATQEKIVRRDVCELYSPGTIAHHDMLSAQAKYLMSIVTLPHSLQTGIAFIDVSTGSLYVGEVSDEPDRNNLYTLMHQICPSEVVFSPGYICQAVIRSLSNFSFSCATGSIASPVDVLAIESTFHQWWEEDQGTLEMILSLPPLGKRAVYCIGKKLENSLLLDSVLKTSHVSYLSSWAVSDISSFNPRDNTSQGVPALATSSQLSQSSPLSVGGQRMVLDSATLTQLDVFEATEANCSLYDFINHTSTPSGARMLRTWLAVPLSNEEAINERLDAVTYFIENPSLSSFCRKGLAKLPDMERTLAKLHQLSIQGERKAIYFGDVVKKRLELFFSVLRAFDDMDTLFMSLIDLAEEKKKTLPKRLLQLLHHSSLSAIAQSSKSSDLAPPRTHDEGKRPYVRAISEEMRKFFSVSTSGDYAPAEGVFSAYDEANENVNVAIGALHQCLERYKTLLNEKRLVFCNSKFRYEVSFPEALEKKVVQQQALKGAEITSTVKGSVRVRTPEIISLVEDLERAEQRRSDTWFPFLQMIFKKFLSYNSLYLISSRCVSELDCLLSLSVASSGSTLSFNRPRFVDKRQGREEADEADFAPYFYAKELFHPIVAAKLQGKFVTNTVTLGKKKGEEERGEKGEKESSMILLTGPNMGGKSTLLRQSAICVLLAHIGCYVPAEDCEMTTVDRIFTRIGARDSLLEGKSTFLIELEETSTILRYGTKRSFAIIDELGRGTSTFDGTAIAYAALQYISNTINCLCLFSTHYHLLADEVNSMENVRNCHLQLYEDDKGTIAFLYKLSPCACPSSYGLYVAKLAGIEDNVLRLAQEKADMLKEHTNRFHALNQ